VIRLRSVDKEYDGRKVLRNLDLQVDAGEFLFVTGPSGAGKTTLLRLLYAAERPTAGEVWVGGERVDNIARARLPGLRRTTPGQSSDVTPPAVQPAHAAHQA
jgi:cell division transport system ATP-binding protein